MQKVHHKGEQSQGDSEGAQNSKQNAATEVIRQITEEDLPVTHFEQTPFSTRYYDTQRSEQLLIRSFYDENLEEDHEEDAEVVLGFELDVPDHFPSSPLCPLSPKHKSGGKAICPLHRKYKKPRAPSVNLTHKVELVFDARGEGGRKVSNWRLARTSSMGSDGAEELFAYKTVDTESATDHTPRQSWRRDSEFRGRKWQRGKSAVDKRQRQQRGWMES